MTGTANGADRNVRAIFVCRARFDSQPKFCARLMEVDSGAKREGLVARRGLGGSAEKKARADEPAPDDEA